MVVKDSCGSPEDWFGDDDPNVHGICYYVNDCSKIEAGRQYENNCTGYSQLIQNICADLKNFKTDDSNGFTASTAEFIRDVLTK
jgi:hypothetical protein